jgi:Protein of unknown function (DUF2855)
MTQSAWAIDIDRDDVTKTEIVGADTEVGHGEILVQVDIYAMTANNVTYAVFGKPAGLFGNDQGYWDFFAERGEPGRLPVWGFATVLVSDIEGVAPGDSFYGYYPMASHAVLVPGNITPGGFSDVTPRRTTLPPIYNQYQRIESLGDYRIEHHDYWPVFRPLFLTGWLIADQFEDDDDYGAEQVLIASASSKTAIGLGYSMKQRAQNGQGGGPHTIGLTSSANAAALAALNIYDSVVAYDDIATLIDPDLPSALVDMAGNNAVTHAVHQHLGGQLKYSMIVGKSHWDAAPEMCVLPGPERQGFFAPGRSQKRLADWGGKELATRLGAAWLGFMEVAPGIAAIDKRSGGEAALEAYHEVLDGRADPKVGIVITP